MNGGLGRQRRFLFLHEFTIGTESHRIAVRYLRVLISNDREQYRSQALTIAALLAVSFVSKLEKRCNLKR